MHQNRKELTKGSTQQDAGKDEVERNMIKSQVN